MDIVADSTVSMLDERRYKACRTCKRQKMRCVMAEGNSVLCLRCLNAGVQCVFDKAASRTRDSGVERPAKRQKLLALSQELDNLKAQMATISQSRTRLSHEDIRQLSSAEAGTQGVLDTVATPPSPLQHHNDTEDCPTFSPENLSVPVTAVHVMMHPPTGGEAERNSVGWTVENQSRWNRADLDKVQRKDIVAQQKLDEVEARNLFDLYMQGANVILPIFDPILDTFDSIRERSHFTFTVILYVAARHQYARKLNHSTLHACKADVFRFSAESLFENPSSLDTTEAMMILAVHSDKSWFALGHTFQMATDLALDQKMRKLVDLSLPGKSHMSSREARSALRCARIWLLITQYERALAFGTIRKSRAPELPLKDLENFLDHAQPHPSDISSCASIDLYQYLIRLQMGKEPSTMDHAEQYITEWFSRWNARLGDNYVHTESFQRSFLKIQECYARIIVGGMMFVHLLKMKRLQSGGLSLANEELVNTGKRTLHLVRGLLGSIDNCSTYKALFSWSPTYEGLLLTFVLVLGFQILFMHPDPEAMQALLLQVENTVTLLETHPCSSFRKVVQRLVHRARNVTNDCSDPEPGGLNQEQVYNALDFESLLQGTDWMFDLPTMGSSYHPSNETFLNESSNFLGATG